MAFHVLMIKRHAARLEMHAFENSPCHRLSANLLQHGGLEGSQSIDKDFLWYFDPILASWM